MNMLCRLADEHRMAMQAILAPFGFVWFFWAVPPKKSPSSSIVVTPPQYVYETNEKGDKVVLGKGTYGMVYAGRDLSNQVRIAIKEIPEKDRT